MSKVTKMRKQELTDHESMMMRHLVKLREQATTNLSEYIGLLLTNRKLSLAEWAVSLADFKSILPQPKTSEPTPDQK